MARHRPAKPTYSGVYGSPSLPALQMRELGLSPRAAQRLPIPCSPFTTRAPHAQRPIATSWRATMMPARDARATTPPFPSRSRPAAPTSSACRVSLTLAARTRSASPPWSPAPAAPTPPAPARSPLRRPAARRPALTKATTSPAPQPARSPASAATETAAPARPSSADPARPAPLPAAA
jgi:hypothetical protein